MGYVSSLPGSRVPGSRGSGFICPRFISNNHSPPKCPPSLCHPACPDVPRERSRGICSSADLSWKRGVSLRNKLFISTGPGFPATLRWTLPRVLLSLRKAAFSAPACCRAGEYVSCRRISSAATSGTLSQNLQVPITVGPVGPSFTVTEPHGVLQLGTYVDSTFQISGIPLPANAQITGFPPGLLLAEAQDEFGDTNYDQTTTLNYLVASCPASQIQLCDASYFSIAYDGAVAGTYPLTLTATWDSITPTTPLTLVVTPPDFTVSVSPPI